MAEMKAGEARTLLKARRALVDLHHGRDPRRGRAAAEALADAQLGPVGRRRVAEAEERVVNKAVKKTLKRRARESAAKGAVRETLTASAAPTQPGAGMAPAVPGGDGASLMDVLRPGLESPYWAVPGGAFVEGAPAVPAAGLHTLDSAELRAFSGSAFAADARARGFASPIWQG